MKIIWDEDGNLVEFDGGLLKKAETDKAILFYNGDREEWIPKSQIVGDPEYLRPGTGDDELGFHLFTVVIPEWLCKEKGFI